MRTLTLLATALAPILSVCVLSGCMSTEIKTRKDSAYHEKLTRTAVYSTVQATMHDGFGAGFASAFESQLAAALIAHGVEVIVVAVDELVLDTRLYEQRITEFAPRTVLSISPISSTRDGYTGAITAVLFDVAIGPPDPFPPRVWRAAVEIRASTVVAPDKKGKKLADDLIAKLVEDGLL